MILSGIFVLTIFMYFLLSNMNVLVLKWSSFYYIIKKATRRIGSPYFKPKNMHYLDE